MYPSAIRSTTAVLLACGLPFALLGAETLGTIVSDGPFRVNQSVVSGSATLFDGAVVETDATPSRMELRGGWMLLGAESKARLHASSIALEHGVGELNSSGKVALTARSLRVVPAGGQSAARVRLEGDRQVLVAALRGPVNVFSATGTLVAKVKAGNSLSFIPQAAAADKFDLSGCLLYKDNAFLLVDPNGAKVVVFSDDAAKTSDLAKATGNRVHVVGTAVGQQSGMPKVNLESMNDVAPGGCLATARAESAAVSAPANLQQVASAAPAPKPAVVKSTPKAEPKEVSVAKTEAPKVEKPKAAPAPPPPPVSTPTSTSGGEKVAKKSHTGAVIAGVAVAAGAGVGAALGMSGKKNTSD